MKHRLRAAIVAALSILACAQLSCRLNDYCLQCEVGDGGVGDGGGGSDAADAAVDAGPCTPTGDEICNGKDDDCDGMIDEGTLPQVGDDCANQMGECAGGKVVCAPKYHCSVTVATTCFGATDTTTCPPTETCVAGDVSTDHLACTKFPTPEICDGKDNDCNGTIDEGDPGGGGRCGNGTGTCVQGVNHCSGACVGAADGCTGTDSVTCSGGTGPQTEVCDGMDDDCDGTIDEGLTNLGTCGSSSIGACKLGTLMCQGGTTVCVGAVNPTLEQCNGKDDDCDGSIDEDFDLMTDPQNCGTCGNACGAGLTDGGNAIWSCSNGTCAIASCKAGYHDNNGDPSDGCEFGPCFISGAEVCDGADNDCDGVIDEDVGAPPAICATQGECAGSTATCQGTKGWTCNYPATVSLDSNGNIVPETKCDGLDNDCNGIIDDNQPPVAHADGTPANPQTCNDGKIGACEGFGTYACDSGNPTGPAICSITQPGSSPTAELCNGKDDDCDGTVDEDAPDTMVDVKDGSGTVLFHIYAYEASRPDATPSTSGVLANRSCSNANVLPWVDVTYDQAAAACAAAGKRLCTATEWQQACAGNASLTYPYGNTYQANACNGKDYDPDCTPPDDDELLPTGTAYGCPTKPATSACVSPSGAYDMSGNVQEWTSTQVSSGVYSVRGGAFDTPAGGLACNFSFVSFSHDFEYGNLGFRCCADAP